MKRPRYQHGFFSRHARKKGPSVWVYRWREIGPSGESKMRSLVVGTVKQYPTETSAWKAVEMLRFDINYQTLRPDAVPEKFRQLSEHYQMVELDLEKPSERKGHQTKQLYETYLRTRIVPRWGDYRVREIKAAAVERWLGSIDDLSNSSKSKLKAIMSDVY